MQTHTDTCRHIRRHTETYRHIQTRTDTYRHIQKHTDTCRRLETPGDTSRCQSERGRGARQPASAWFLSLAPRLQQQCQVMPRDWINEATCSRAGKWGCLNTMLNSFVISRAVIYIYIYIYICYRLWFQAGCWHLIRGTITHMYKKCDIKMFSNLVLT